jgi:peptidoglycan hydrolase-like protein with peptidoglycan-binding domain
MEHVIQGSQGDAVKTLQLILNDIGYTIEPNGIFCPATTRAVLHFQKSVSITEDGAVGDVTWAFLLNVQALKAKAKENDNLQNS